MLSLTIPEPQLVDWLTHLSPEAKYTILRVLIPTLAEDEALVDYGAERARAVAAQRGLVWDALSEAQRLALIDTLAHEG